jgi:hypothetical protein
MSDPKQKPLNEGRVPQNSPKPIVSDKQVTALANARLPAETPRNLKGTAHQLGGRIPSGTEMLALTAGRVAPESPKAISVSQTQQSGAEKKITTQASFDSILSKNSAVKAQANKPK